MEMNGNDDLRWTVRFSDADELMTTRNLARLYSRYSGERMGAIINAAMIAHFSAKWGPELAKAFIEASRQ